MPCFTFKLVRPFIAGEAAVNVGSGPHQTHRPRGISLTEVPPKACRGHTLAGVPDGDEATPGALQSCVHTQLVLALQDRSVSAVSAHQVPKFDHRPWKQNMEMGPECAPRAQKYLAAAGSQDIDVYRGRRDVCLGCRPQGFQKFVSRLF